MPNRRRLLYNSAKYADSINGRIVWGEIHYSHPRNKLVLEVPDVIDSNKPMEGGVSADHSSPPINKSQTLQSSWLATYVA